MYFTDESEYDFTLQTCYTRRDLSKIKMYRVESHCLLLKFRMEQHQTISDTAIEIYRSKYIVHQNFSKTINVVMQVQAYRERENDV
jgi:hypothetical protein